MKYGIEFHFELTGLKNEEEQDAEKKHYNIIKRRLEKGQCFRTPCLGCNEFPVKSISLLEKFDENMISERIIAMGDVDLGFMSKECIFNCNKRFKNLWLQFFLSQNQGFMRLFEKTVLK